MNLKNFIKKENIALPLKGSSKKEVIQELLDVFVENGEIDSEDREDLFSELLKREQKGSTGIGNTLAIPHCKSQLIDDVHVAVGVNSQGIDFESVDDQKAKIFILTLTTNSAASPHLQFLAFIANLFKEDAVRTQVINSKNRDDLYDLLISHAG